jgi:hypothetical protein
MHALLQVVAASGEELQVVRGEGQEGGPPQLGSLVDMAVYSKYALCLLRCACCAALSCAACCGMLRAYYTSQLPSNCLSACLGYQPTLPPPCAPAPPLQEPPLAHVLLLQGRQGSGAAPHPSLRHC